MNEYKYKGFTLVYSDKIIDGSTIEEWNNAPDNMQRVTVHYEGNYSQDLPITTYYSFDGNKITYCHYKKDAGKNPKKTNYKDNRIRHNGSLGDAPIRPGIEEPKKTYPALDEKREMFLRNK